MKKLIFVLLIAIQAQAQTFSFECEPTLATTYLQWIVKDPGPWVGYGVVNYSGDNNKLRQMSIIYAVDGERPDHQNFFSDLTGEHVLTIATELGQYDVTEEGLENSIKEDVNIIIYDCAANRPISEDLTFHLDEDTLILDITEIPENVRSWTLFGSKTTEGEYTYFQYESNGRYSQSITISGTQQPWVDGVYDVSIFPNFPVPEGHFMYEPYFSFNTAICNYGGIMKNSNPGPFEHSWIETSIGTWTSVDFPGYHLDNLKSSNPTHWKIDINSPDGHTLYSNGSCYSFDHFLFQLSYYINY